jgi:hypothetical protein
VTQPDLPYQWYESHYHGDGTTHQHFPLDGDEANHAGVAMLSFDPAKDGAPGDLQVFLDKIRADNQELLEGMLRAGARPDPASMVLLRVELLVDTLLGTDTPHRQRFEAAYELRMANVLTQMMGLAGRAKLLAPAPPPGEHPTRPHGMNQRGLVLPPGGRR